MEDYDFGSEIEEGRKVMMKKLEPGSVYPIYSKMGTKFYFYCEVEEINFPLKFKISSKSAVTETFISFFHEKPWKDTSNIISRNKEINICYPEEFRKRVKKRAEKMKQLKSLDDKEKSKKTKESIIPEEQLAMFLSKELKKEDKMLNAEDPVENEVREISKVYFTVRAHNDFDANLRLYFYKMKTTGRVKRKGLMLLEKNRVIVGDKEMRVNYNKILKFCKYGLRGLDTPRKIYGKGLG